MHERKLMMANRSDAFVTLPGGLGTFEEIFEILTWRQLNLHSKPTYFLNLCGFFNPLIQLLQTAVNAGFLRQETVASIVFEADPHALANRVAADLAQLGTEAREALASSRHT